MVNYNNGKIYKIINENNETIYIGSTVQSLSQRYTKHSHKAPNNKIILIENYSCDNCEELRKREQEVIEEHNNLLNKNRAYTMGNSKEQSSHRKEYKKLWYLKNKERILEKLKLYKECNKDRLREYNKEYEQSSHRKEYKKLWYLKNKERILEKLKLYNKLK